MPQNYETERPDWYKPCPKAPDGKHIDEGGMFTARCALCGAVEDENYGVDTSQDYPRLGN